MPTYVYKCRKCQNEFEYRQSINDEALTECVLTDENGVKCDGEVFRKISSNVGLVFNGKGFYQTDYTSKSTSAPVKETAGHAPACASCAAGK